MELPSINVDLTNSKELQSFLKKAAPFPGLKPQRKKSWRIGLIGHGVDRTDRLLVGNVLAQRALSEKKYSGQDDTAQ